MRRFFRWLFPAHYSPYAKCLGCTRARLKTEMYRMPGYGLFCTKEEADRYWVSFHGGDPSLIGGTRG